MCTARFCEARTARSRAPQEVGHGIGVAQWRAGREERVDQLIDIGGDVALEAAPDGRRDILSGRVTLQPGIKTLAIGIDDGLPLGNEKRRRPALMGRRLTSLVHPAMKLLSIECAEPAAPFIDKDTPRQSMKVGYLNPAPLLAVGSHQNIDAMLQARRESAGKGSKEQPGLRISLKKPMCPMKSNDGLASACPTRNVAWPVILAFHGLSLPGVQERRPLLPRPVQCFLQLALIVDNVKATQGVWMLEGIRHVDRRRDDRHNRA